MYYSTGSGAAEYFRGSGTYPTWPTLADQYSTRNYSIYCTYTPATQFTCGVEFTGASNSLDWTQLIWKVNSTFTVPANVTLQLYNYTKAQYPTSGYGYVTGTSATSMNGTWTIPVNPADFRKDLSSMEWKVNVTAVAASLFDMKIDLVRYTTTNTYYGLDLEEQWTNVNITRPNQDLCIKMGNFLGSENLMVDVWDNRSGQGHWDSLFNATNLLVNNTWNNVSVTQYLTSSTFTIRFRSNDTSDTHQDYWNTSSVLLNPQPDLGFLLSQQDSTMVVEWLQNGVMRWLGQNLNLTSQAKPIPPIPVKAIHVNQTINGVDREVPFQVEDWASNYSIPLGLAGSATVFGSRQMIVFLLNTTVSKVTVWWNGSDMATQTPFATTPGPFNDNPSAGTLNNGKLTLQFGGGSSVTSTVGSASSTASFMRINGYTSDYGAGLAYVIVGNGPVRDIVQQEAEWGGGVLASSCPNIYANMVLTLPAGTTYFTYQLKLMFINSTQRPRNITDLCPIQLSTSLGTLQVQTENGTIGTSPIVVNGTGTFKNYTIGGWTPHHWSQFISDPTSAGAGIMFTNASNQQLYFFDSKGTSLGATGALNVSSTAKTIELAPVTSLHQVSNYATPSGEDVTWYGAVATFDGNTTPIYRLNAANNTQMGLWILVEYQPTITVNSEA